MTTIDDYLMLQFVDGDKQAFTQLVNRHKHTIFQYIYSKVSDSELAADLSQDVFVKLYKNAHLYTPTGKFRSWLFRIAQNICIDAFRKRKPATLMSLDISANRELGNSYKFQETLHEPVADPEAEFETKETTSIIKQAISSLPEKQRTAFVLCQFQGLSYAEIAAIQGCPVGTVKSRIHTAITALRDILKMNDLL